MRQIRILRVQKVKTPKQESTVYSFLWLFFLVLLVFARQNGTSKSPEHYIKRTLPVLSYFHPIYTEALQSGWYVITELSRLDS